MAGRAASRPRGLEGRLIIQAEGHVPLRDTLTYLFAVNTLYGSVRAFELLPHRVPEQIKLPPRTLYQFVELPKEDELILSSVRLESPGAWELIGKLNPLEFIRKMINDHHRRKIEMARLPESLRRSKLENDLREMDLLQRQIEVARNVGFSEEEITGFLRERIIAPSRQIQAAQDAGLIATADVETIDT
jgi:hypothetical protein